MLANWITNFDSSLSLAAISVVLCPTLCALMAYRISRSSASVTFRGAR